MKFPATDIIMYPFTKSLKFSIARPINVPASDIKFMTPLHKMVCFSLNLLRSKMATSPISRGISCTIIATSTGTIIDGFPVAKETPIAIPSKKLWIKEPKRFK